MNNQENARRRRTKISKDLVCEVTREDQYFKVSLRSIRGKKFVKYYNRIDIQHPKFSDLFENKVDENNEKLYFFELCSQKYNGFLSFFSKDGRTLQKLHAFFQNMNTLFKKFLDNPNTVFFIQHFKFE